MSITFKIDFKVSVDMVTLVDIDGNVIAELKPRGKAKLRMRGIGDGCAIADLLSLPIRSATARSTGAVRKISLYKDNDLIMEFPANQEISGGDIIRDIAATETEEE